MVLGDAQVGADTPVGGFLIAFVPLIFLSGCGVQPETSDWNSHAVIEKVHARFAWPSESHEESPSLHSMLGLPLRVVPEQLPPSNSR